MKRVVPSLISLLVIFPLTLRGEDLTSLARIRAALERLSPHVAADTERQQLSTMLGHHLRGQIAAANQASAESWAKIQSREDWEEFRREKLQLLRKSLGDLPDRPPKPRALVTGRLQGERFQIHNLVYESRPGVAVTANLYIPDPRRQSMPGILVSHSHHNPKDQGELQDMGMTWARAGCYVLVPDHLGHGERRQHPFVSDADYPGPFQVGRQDYYFRYDTSLQLYLAGESLMGWMVQDLMTGVDLLFAQPGIDGKRIILLGSVAGGGDPAAVTAALDERIACVCPFNFGGPEPETQFPLPENAETSFNYAGSGSWESTRNLYRSAAEGFLPWVIAGSVAPRYLIHAHEFAWDGERDPVWKRYQRIWQWHGASDRLSFTHGQGTLTGQDPPGSHCNNIGVVHRRQIHETFRKWFNIDVQPEDEYSHRPSREELTCLTDAARRGLEPKPLHEILREMTEAKLAIPRELRSKMRADERRRFVQGTWRRLLGNVEPPGQIKVQEGFPPIEEVVGVTVRRELLETETGILVPLITLTSSRQQDNGDTRRPTLVCVATDGIPGILGRHRAEIAAKLHSGWLIGLAEVRGTGSTSPGDDHGQQSASAAQSATYLMLGSTMLAGQLRDLRAVWRHLRRHPNVSPGECTILGDSGVTPLATDESFAYPRRANARPRECQPTGPLLALLFGLFEEDVKQVRCRDGLVSYQSIVESPFVQIPHECVVPGILQESDLADLVAALAPCEVSLSRLVDGRGRLVRMSQAKSAYEITRRAYADANAQDRLRFSELATDD